jgi:DNA-binding protein HU-beta
VNKAELIEAITDRVGDKRTAAAAVEAVVDTITRTVTKGEKVAITGFGVFEKQNRPARTVRNPATGASIKKKKTSVPKFRPGAGFKSFVSGDKKLPAPAKATPTKTTAKKTAAASTSGTTTRGAAKKTAGTGRKAAASKATTKSTSSKTAASKTTAKRAPAAKKTSARGAAKTTSTRGGAKKTAAKRSR